MGHLGPGRSVREVSLWKWGIWVPQPTHRPLFLDPLCVEPQHTNWNFPCRSDSDADGSVQVVNARESPG